MIIYYKKKKLFIQYLSYTRIYSFLDALRLLKKTVRIRFLLLFKKKMNNNNSLLQQQ